MSFDSALYNAITVATITQKLLNTMSILSGMHFIELQQVVEKFGHRAYLELEDHTQGLENNVCAIYKRPSTLKIATAFDPEWQRTRNRFYFELPEDFEVLEKFIQHDRELL